MMGLSLLGAAGLAACHGSNPAPVAPQTEISAPAAPLVYRSTTEVEAATRNSVTADELKPGQHRFTALGVDSDQSSKHYHQPDSVQEDNQHAGLSLKDGAPFQQCLATNEATGKCKQSKSNQISHVTLSCLYRDEADGQTYRVVHKSMEHYYTHAMDRMVCGGHELKRGEGEFASYMPSQVDAAGNQLYLNPANVIAILPAS